MAKAKLHLPSRGIVSMQFLGKQAEDAETAVSLLAPSCEFNSRIGQWVFPLPYLPDVVRVLRKHVGEIRVSLKTAEAYRRQKRHSDAILRLKAKPTSAFAESPYSLLFREDCMPHPYQRQGIATMLAAKRLLLGDAVGLGKTIQSVGAIALAMESGICQRAMVVTKASIKGQWRDEAQKYLLPDAVSGLASGFTVVSGEKPKRIEAYRDPAARVLVLNYELFLHDLKHMPPVDMIILDEAASIKSLDAQTTKNIKAFCAKHRIRYRYALTATAIENRLEDLLSILAFLGDRSLGFYVYFLYHYCKMRRFQAPNGAQVTQIIGHLNLAEAKGRTGHILLRRTKDDVGIELPELVIRNVAIDLTAKQREKYETIKVEAANPDSKLNPLQRSLLLREVCDSLGLVESSGDESSKLDELERFVKECLGSDHSVVIFTQWARMAKLIAERLAGCYDASSAPRIISGGVKDKARDTHRRDFNDKKFRCLVMTDAGKAGLNLQTCETMVNFELPWNPATLKQRIGRMHRSGQKHKVTTVVNFITNHTIEHNVADRLMRRHRVFDKVLTAAEDELQAMDFSRTLTMADLMELA